MRVFALAAMGAMSLPAGWACDRALAARLHHSGDLAGAVREYRDCLAAEPQSVELRSDLGAALAGLGRYEEAIGEYLQALKSAPTAIASRLRLNLALAYYKSSQLGPAASELEALHAGEPSDVRIALLLADCALRVGNYRRAIDVLAPVDKERPGEPAVDYALGMALIRDGHVGEGQIRLDRILAKGESAEGRFLLGSARFMSGDYPGAANEFAKAAALNPNLPSLESYYGQALLRTGDAQAAAQAFRKELAGNPADFDANFQLAAILARTGKADEARPLLERAVRARPGSAEAREALEKGFRFDAPAAADGVPVGAAAPAIAGIELSAPAKPVLLVFGSYTCPQLRGSIEDLKRLYAEYRTEVDFRLVYIREAHPSGEWDSSINQREGIALPAAANMTEKEAHAQLCVRRLNLEFPAVTDSMDGAAEAAYGAWPSRAYLVGSDGRVVFETRLGELDFHADKLADAVRAAVKHARVR